MKGEDVVIVAFFAALVIIFGLGMFVVAMTGRT